MPQTPICSASWGAAMVVLEVTQVAMAVAVPSASPTRRPASMNPSRSWLRRPKYQPSATHNRLNAARMSQPVPASSIAVSPTPVTALPSPSRLWR